MMRERRRAKRAKKFFAINIVAVEMGKKRIAFDRARSNPKFYDESGLDFGPDGIKIMCSKPLPEESKIQMKMLIPDDEDLNLIRANGTIRWFRQAKSRYKKYFIMGVHFKELRDEDKEKLVRLWKKYKE
jgi:c-di-GMP-binding flagellar brake protein YcgR